MAPSRQNGKRAQLAALSLERAQTALRPCMMKIYFAGSIRGGRDDAALYMDLIRELQRYGEVLTEHVGNDALLASGEADRTDKWIHDRDLAWLTESDVVVAEVTQPSLGVGYELGRAVEMKRRVVCLFRPASGRCTLSAQQEGTEFDVDVQLTRLPRARSHAALSAMIAGAVTDDNLFSVHSYQTLEDAVPILRSQLGSGNLARN
eukprot:m.155186 g.155186  ORF g.155186 m.155186 type:complete len:205 (+) comp10202_c0_seq5:2039-2653(+)